MRKFSDLFEAPQTLVFAFGRFNPPTTGHEKLIKKVASVAGSNPYRIYPSFTTNPKKDPLPHSLKVAYMRKMFPKHRKNIIADNKMKTAIFIAEAVYKEGFKRSEDVSFLINLFGEENIIFINQDEMYNMHSNILSVSEKLIISDKRFLRLNNEIRKFGIKVEEVNYSEIAKMEGLLRCSTLPIKRKWNN